MSNNVTHDIVAKLWNLCNVLKDDGVTYHQYVTELTYLLFLKMAKETGTEDQLPDGLPLGRPGGARPRPTGWSSTSSLLIHLGSHGSPLVQEIFANASSFIKKPATLSTLVTEIDKLDWYSARQEGLGDLYEGLLEKNANEKKSGAGQYFTPRPLIDSMVAVMKPTLDDVIQDPAAGTGGFLIAANRYLREHSDPDALDRGAAAQVPPRHLLRHGARAGHPPPGADEPDAARPRLRPRGRRHPLRRHALARRRRRCPRPR